MTRRTWFVSISALLGAKKAAPAAPWAKAVAECPLPLAPHHNWATKRYTATQFGLGIKISKAMLDDDLPCMLAHATARANARFAEQQAAAIIFGPQLGDYDDDEDE